MERYILTGLSIIVFIIITGIELFGLYVELMHYVHVKVEPHDKLEFKEYDKRMYESAIMFRNKMSRSIVKIFITFIIIVASNSMLYSDLDTGEFITFGFFTSLIIIITKVFIDD
jgi:hypothetical protein